MLADFVSLVNETQENFLGTTLTHTIPHLVLDQRESILATVARIIGKPLPQVLVENMLGILCAVLLAPTDKTDKGFDFLVRRVGVAGLDRYGRVEKVNAEALIKLSEPVQLFYTLVVELGDTNPAVVQRVSRSIHSSLYSRPF